MKFIQLLSFFFVLCLSPQVLGEDLTAINQSIDGIEKELKTKKLSKSYLLNANQKIPQKRSILNACVDEQLKNIHQTHLEWNSLKFIQKFKTGLTKREDISNLLDSYQDQKYFCQYMLLKLDNLKATVYLLSKKLYVENLLFKMPAIWDITVPDISFHFSFTGDYYKNLFFNIYSQIAFLGLLVVMFLKGFGQYFFKSRQFFQCISIVRYLKLLPLFLFTSPIMYMYLNNFFSYDEIYLIYILGRPGFVIYVLFFIGYVYWHYDLKNFNQDAWLLVLQFCCLNSLMYVVKSIYDEQLHFGSESMVLFYQYVGLILLFVLGYLIDFWMFIRILNMTAAKNKFLTFTFLIPIVNLLIGSLGYLNLAIYVQFILIINVIIVSYLLIIFRLKNISSSFLRNMPLDKIFSHYKNIALIHLNLLINYIFFAGVIVFLLLLFVGTFSLFSQGFFMKLFEWIFVYPVIKAYNLHVMGFAWSFFVLLVLDLLNFAISKYWSFRLCSDDKSRQTMMKLFNCIGYTITLVIILKVIGLPLQNLLFIISGLSIGIGLGLKNVLSGLISSLILFMNKSFEVGDYIKVGDTKGYVKNISLLETLIETEDNNKVILPNQLIASSVVQNYTYGHKQFYRIHMTYILKQFNIQAEGSISSGIKTLLRNQAGVLGDKPQHIKLIFSLIEQTTDAYRVEIIFSIDNSLHLKEALTEISRKIFSQLQTFNQAVVFEKMEYPSQ